MSDKVVDASVLAAIAFEEPRWREAGAMLNGASLFALSLLVYELCGVACKKARQRPEQHGAVLEGPRYALALEVTLVEVEFDSLFALACATGLAAYDAAYLYVARNPQLPARHLR